MSLPSSAEVWSAIGYKTDKPIMEGEPATLYRTKETSPDFLNIDPDEIIKFSMYEEGFEMPALYKL